MGLTHRLSFLWIPLLAADWWGSGSNIILVHGYEVHSKPTLSPWRKWLLDMFSTNGGTDIYDLLRERNYDCPNFPDINLPHLERY